MIIQCQTCGTQFRIDDKQIGDRGAKVRCGKCGSAFMVDKSGTAKASVPELPPLPRGATQALDESADSDATTIARAAPAGPTSSRPGKPEEDLSFVDADLLGDAGGVSDVSVGASPRAPTRSLPMEEAPTVVSSGLDVEPDNDQYLTGGLSLDGTLVPPEPAAPPVNPGGSFEAVTRAVSRDELIRHQLEAAPETAVAKADVLHASVASAPGAGGDGASVLARIAKGLGTLLVVAVLIFGGLVFLGGGKIDARLLRFDKQAMQNLWGVAPQPALDGVQVSAMRAVVYPVSGLPVLVFFGDAKNSSGTTRSGLDVVATVRTRAGRVMASERAPLGVSLTPPELASLHDSSALAALYQAKVGAAGPSSLSPGAVAPFTVVIFRPPPQLESLEHIVELAPSKGWQAERPPPAEPTAADLEALGKGKKGKGKLKGKAKGKAKARTDGEAAGG
jgi:predicted Zn finger-like uncharacterized protein